MNTLEPLWLTNWQHKGGMTSSLLCHLASNLVIVTNGSIRVYLTMVINNLLNDRILQEDFHDSTWMSLPELRINGVRISGVFYPKEY